MKRMMLSLLATLLMCVSAMSAEVPLCTGEWPPFVMQHGPNKGVMSEIVSEAFKAAGDSISLTFGTWVRCEMNTLQGSFFATYPYVYTKERYEKYDFSEPFFAGGIVAFYMKKRFPDPPDFRELKDLRPYKIGGTQGYFYIPMLKKLNVPLDIIQSHEANFKKLHSNRVDFVLERELVGKFLIRKLFPGEEHLFAHVGRLTHDNEVRLMVSRSYPKAKEIVERFNKGLAIIMNNGKYNAILTKHGLSPERFSRKR